VHRIPDIQLIENVKCILGNLLDRGERVIQNFFYPYVDAAVIVMMPGRSHPVILFQNHGWNVLMFETGCHGQTGRAGTNYDYMIIHAEI
jgi:hypothetical protein